eukprot:1299420-Prymnesium_polylepis.1
MRRRCRCSPHCAAARPSRCTASWHRRRARARTSGSWRSATAPPSSAPTSLRAASTSRTSTGSYAATMQTRWLGGRVNAR